MNEIDHSQKILDWLSENNLVAEKTVTFLHDMWCASMYQHKCNCTPNVYVNGKQVSYPGNLLR